MLENICRCNDCGELMIDSNPSEDSLGVDIDVLGIDLPYMVEQGQGEDVHYVCPFCLTDTSLVDITEQQDLLL